MNSEQSGSILVVEDEALLLFTIADDLRDAGFTVYEASNAATALKVLEQHMDISILFTDVDMPGQMDGLKLSRAVRDRWPPVRIIVTSGHVNLTDSDLPIIGRFIPKPYTSSAILLAVQTSI
jgi:CheY-like chemotaxis protein